LAALLTCKANCSSGESAELQVWPWSRCSVTADSFRC